MNKYVFFVLGGLSVASVSYGAASTFQDGLVVGGTSLTSGLLVEVEGKIGAQEICNESGTECTDVTNIYNFVSGGTGVTGTAGYVPYFDTANSIANSVVRQSADGNIGIAVAGMANGDSQSSRLRVSGNLKVDSRHLYLGSQDLYGDNSSALYYDSNHSTIAQIVLRDTSNSYLGALRAQDTSGINIVGLMDSDSDWALLHYTDLYTIWRVDNTERMRLTPTGLGIGTTVPEERIQTPGNIEAGKDSGAIALTINDGYGNSNVTFNHTRGIPDQNGNAARIEVNTDATTNPSMRFQLRPNVTGGAAVGLTEIMKLQTDGTDPFMKVSGQVWGEEYCNADGTSCFDMNRLCSMLDEQDITRGPFGGFSPHWGKVTESGHHNNDSRHYGSYLFDDEYSTAWDWWLNNSSLLPEWITVRLYDPKIVNKYRMYFVGSARDPRDWQFQGSADNSTWTTLHTITANGITSGGWTPYYTFTNNTAYEYYRLYITAANGDTYFAFYELELYSADLCG